MSHYEGYNCPPGAMLYVRDGFLGNVAIRVEMAQTPENAIEALARWRVDFQKEPSDHTNGDLRFLGIDEITAASAMSVAISDELGRQRRTLDQFDVYMSQLKGMLQQVESLHATGVEAAQSTETCRAYAQLAHACNAVIRNVTVSLDGGGNYCRKVQYAWLKYLSEIYKADRALIRSVQ